MGATDTVLEVREPEDRVLLVDDDPSIRRLLRNVLARRGFEIVEAGDGDEAIEVVTRAPVNLVVTDVMMPRRSGIELLQHMHGAFPQVPVILITGKPAVEAAVECMRNGAYDYISKPFDLAKISATVVRALEEHHRVIQERLASQSQNINYRRFFGDFKVIRVLGEGNIGIVFLAEKTKQPELPQYALKILKPQYSGEERRQVNVDRFLSTAKAVAVIRHPNLINVFEYGLTSDEQIPFVVMEYFDGQSLRQYVETGVHLSYSEKTTILLQIAEGLAAIHEHHICHRDIKPHNVMINEAGLVKVADFGIARLPDSELTVSNELIGTPAYLSPEGFRTAQVTPRADLFSFGVLAYELYFGRRPFEGETIPHFAHAICQELPVAPHQMDPHFPAPLAKMLAHLLKKNPAHRYPRTELLVLDLKRYLDAGSHAEVWAGPGVNVPEWAI